MVYLEIFIEKLTPLAGPWEWRVITLFGVIIKYVGVRSPSAVDDTSSSRRSRTNTVAPLSSTCFCCRPYFTYWVTFVQIVIFIIAVAVYGIAPIGFEETLISDEVTSLEIIFSGGFFQIALFVINKIVL